ncbi:nickel-responsive transcriptional regulator NikR [Aureimonas glaciei]|uniref:Putative nickel-responsive regulator n=1 Tax=Aureimonas glaciei TaxID=1776957 RepID=A0A916XVV5_9HYPH|nr:nickel-responsive transcriptional regulator NikR [Aureimonas glaciei]GGD15764.1 putative nickel-responsive regulator [Aureimonas glaciei]
MQRVTVTLDDDLMADLDAIMAERGYQNRSEAIRDLTRAGLTRAKVEAGTAGNCVAALVYTYDHSARDLSRRLTNTHHDHHALSVSSLHVHLDHETCMEVSILKGPTREVRHFAEHVIAERSVRHGELVLIPDAGTGAVDAPHHHGAGADITKRR